MAIELVSHSLFSDANLVGYWKLEDVNDSKGSNTLTNTNTVTFTAAKFNNGANFSDANTNKDLGVDSNLGITGGNITMNFWVKNLAEIGAGLWGFASQTDATNDVAYIVLYDYNSGTRRLTFRRSVFGDANYDVNYNVTMGTSDFYMITLRYNGTNIAGYVNGQPVGTPTASSGNGTGGNTSCFSIGCGRATTDGSKGAYASALIDDVSVFNRALSDAEILDYYNSTAGGFLGIL